MKMSRRILSVVLAAALLITCGITGLVLPVSAASGNLIINGNYEQGNSEGIANSKGKGGVIVQKGFGTEDSWGATVTKDTSSTAATAKLLLYKATSGHVKEDMRADTVYMLKFDYKNDGGKTQVYFKSNYGTAVASSLSKIKMGTPCNTGYTLSEGGTDGWQSGYIVYQGSTPTNQDNGVTFQRGSSTGTLSIDNVELHKVDLSVAPSVKNGTINLSTAGSPDPAAWVLDAAEGTDVTVQVTPKDGYMMVPGSLKYTTAGNSNGVNILNKAESGFGDGAGDKFTFKMPAEPAQVTAEFVQVADGDYRMDSIGTSVHYTDGQADGIRFLTRLALADGFSAGQEGLSLNGQAVEEIGTLLARGSKTLDEMEALKLDGSAEGVWKGINYTADTDTYKVVDYTDTYLDFATVMMTKKTDTTYTAVGYILLENGEVLYSTSVKTGSIDSAEAALDQAKL